jgi:hypothetical protein
MLVQYRKRHTVKRLTLPNSKSNSENLMWLGNPKFMIDHRQESNFAHARPDGELLVIALAHQRKDFRSDRNFLSSQSVALQAINSPRFL